MPIELTCGKCRKRLRVERRGVVVACPHCGVHLSVPEADAAQQTPDADDSGQTPAESPEPSPVDDEPSALDGFDPGVLNDGPGEFPDFDVTENNTSDTLMMPNVTARDDVSGLDSTVTMPKPDLGGDTPAKTVVEKKDDAPPGDSKSPKAAESSRDSGTVSKKKFVLVASYASAVTIALIYILLRSRASQLESLPDIEPLEQGKVQYVRPEYDLPPGHELRFGDEQRFGNIVMRPLKVTREPIEFVHYSDDESQTKPPSDPVLKLWVEFENVSGDQTFAPLDLLLLTNRAGREGEQETLSNTFLCRCDDRSTNGSLLLNYDHPFDSSFDMKDGVTRRGTPLGPGNKLTTYIASDEFGIDEVAGGDGELVWRLQIRKGLNSGSGNGVTTLVDVIFGTSQITGDAA